MFATLLGGLPPPDPDDRSPESAARAACVAQAEAGLEPLSAAGRLPEPPLDDPAAWVAQWSSLAEASERVVKAVILGPYTRVRRAVAAVDPANLAEQTRAVVDALAAAGCPFVEIDEPDAVAIGRDAGERARFRDAHLRLATDAPVHLSLAPSGGNVDVAGSATFVDPPYASYAVDLVAGPDNWRLLADVPGDRGVVIGALRPGDGTDDGPELLVWAAHYAASLQRRGLDRVGLANAPGLERLPWAVAERKLHRLAEAARIAALPRTGELAEALDPRAVNLKSRALGRRVPRRRA